ncbi:hypothetical protein ACFVRB_12725 [Streptomyces nojiriensis]|uniref:hypothetical protein n=1 Tax=Streptomyces nojiriensis TaxID=66374 RepID=UPI0036D9C59D
MRLSPARTTVGAVFGALAVVTVATVGIAHAEGSATPAGAAEELPPLAVEDFKYPDADSVFEKQNIRLKTGDGHITLAECGSKPGLIEVWTSQDVGTRFCFQVTGSTGYLSLELPRVYAVKGNDYKLRVDMKVDNREVSFDIKNNQWTPVGKSTDPEKREHMLMEIFATN